MIRNVCGVLFLVLLVLKLIGVGNITWLGVFAPIFVGAGIVVLLWLCGLILAALGITWLSR